MKGIDVSVYQGDIDFEQVKSAGIDYVVIKAGVSTRTDDNYETNYQKAKDAGLYVGFYWYCYGETISEIEAEAAACIEALKGKPFEYPIYMDFEEQSQLNLGKDFCTEAVKTFCNKLEKAGYFVGLYTSTSFLDSVIDDYVKEKYTLWVADWRGYCGYNGKYDMWQYGAGYVPGINGKTDFNVFDIGYDTDYPSSVVEDGVDLDYAYMDFPSVIVANGYNNNSKSNIPWEEDPCRDVADSLSISGVTPIMSGDKWFLIDKSCKFTLKTLPFAKVNIYLVGGGEDGAEWYKVDVGGKYIAYDIDKKCRGGCVFKKEIYIEGNTECQAVIAEANNPTGTTLKIGNEIYKCTDNGYIQRKATANGYASQNSKCSNGENGASGVKTPYGYVGSSGGGGGTHSSLKGNIITVYAGKGGIGAGNGGNLKENGTDATNYGCGGGSAGFGGLASAGETVKTHAGKGMKGCIIFEILDGGMCDNSPNKPNVGNENGNGNSGNNGNCNCGCPQHTFTCPDPSESSTNSEKETNYTLTYENGEPVITENTTSSNNGVNPVESSGNTSSSHNSSNCNCSGGQNNSQTCSCGSDSNSQTHCVNLDVAKWGNNWLLFNKNGQYSLTVDEDMTLTAYLVGGGCDGKDGIYFNGTAYGGEGGRGGCYAVVPDIKVSKGQMNIDVKIGGRGEYNGTSVIINNNEYACNRTDYSVNDGGFQGICGKHGYQQAGNGADGIETPFGYIGSSGGGGAAYYNTESTNRGRGGLSAGNGGKIVNGKATTGSKASGYGCGGGGGAATSTSWCEGGRGKSGCAILTW